MFIKKRKITKASIEELAKRYPQDIISDEDAKYIVGGSGEYSCGGLSCYSYEQYIAQSGSGQWMGGCVDMGNEHIYIAPQPFGCSNGSSGDGGGSVGYIDTVTIIGESSESLKERYRNWFMAGMLKNPSGSWGWEDFANSEMNDLSGNIDGGSGAGGTMGGQPGNNGRFEAGQKCVFESMKGVWYDIYGKNVTLSILESQFAAKYRTGGSTVSPTFGEVNGFLRDNFTVTSYEVLDNEASLSSSFFSNAVKTLDTTTNKTPSGSTPKMLIVIDQDPSSDFKLHMVEFDCIDSEGRIRITDPFNNSSYTVTPEMIQGCYVVSKK